MGPSQVRAMKGLRKGHEMAQRLFYCARDQAADPQEESQMRDLAQWGQVYEASELEGARDVVY